MGLTIKGAGVAIGGLTAIWLANKLLNVGSKMVHDISEASKWKAYYRSKDPYAVPPGYARSSYKDPETGDNIVVKSPEEQNAEKNQERQSNLNENRQKVDIQSLGDTAEKIARAYFRSKGIDMDQPDRKFCRYTDPSKSTTYRDLYYRKNTRADVNDNISELFDENKQSPEEKLRESIRSMKDHDIPVCGDTDGDEVLPVKEMPYFILASGFFEEHKEYDKSTLDWYEEDDIVTDELEEIIPDPKSYVGMRMKELFDNNPYATEDPDMVYVRNDLNRTDYEIVRHHASYGNVIGGDISKDENKGDEDK